MYVLSYRSKWYQALGNIFNFNSWWIPAFEVFFFAITVHSFVSIVLMDESNSIVPYAKVQGFCSTFCQLFRPAVWQVSVHKMFFLYVKINQIISLEGFYIFQILHNGYTYLPNLNHLSTPRISLCIGTIYTATTCFTMSCLPQIDIKYTRTFHHQRHDFTALTIFLLSTWQKLLKKQFLTILIHRGSSIKRFHANIRYKLIAFCFSAKYFNWIFIRSDMFVNKYKKWQQRQSPALIWIRIF